MRALVITEHGAAEIRDIEPASEELENIVDGQAGLIAAEGWHLYCDEDGHSKHRAYNAIATALVHLHKPGFHDSVRGTVIAFGGDPPEKSDIPEMIVNQAEYLAGAVSKIT